MRISLFLFSLFAVIGTSGCSNDPPKVIEDREPLAGGMNSMMPIPAFEYLVGPGDVLRVNVFRHPELGSGIYRANTPGSPVDAGGMISLPLIGDVIASGRTVFTVRDEIETRLAAYLRTPKADVSVLEHNAHRFYVFGEIRRPGVFIMDRPTTAMEGLALAGGYTLDADRMNVALIRGPIAEENITIFDTKDLDPVAGSILQSGDILFVTQRKWASIGQAARDLVPLLQLVSLPIGTARDVVLIEDIRKD
jgi:polysaccharide biosynthesis/export protein